MKIDGYYYFDVNATQKMGSYAIEALLEGEKRAFANPSANYPLGKKAKEVLEFSREKILKRIKFKGNLIFTSSATESNHTAIFSFIKNPSLKRIVISKIEHPSVYALKEIMCKWGKEVVLIGVDRDCKIKLDELEDALKDKECGVSLIYAHNETGVIQNFNEIYKICKKYNALLHLDCVQAFSKVDLPFEENSPNSLSIASHKIGGPKGVASFAFKKDLKIYPIFYGGGQEKGLRASTESIPLIYAFAKVALKVTPKKYEKIKRLRDYFEKALKTIANVTIYGENAERLPNTSFFSIENVDGKFLQKKLAEKKICVGTGSACHSSCDKLPKALIEMGYKNVSYPLRISFSIETMKEDVDHLLFQLEKIIKVV